MLKVYYQYLQFFDSQAFEIYVIRIKKYVYILIYKISSNQILCVNFIESQIIKNKFQQQNIKQYLYRQTMIKSQVRSTSKLQPYQNNPKLSTPTGGACLNRSHQKQISLITASMLNREKQNKNYRIHAGSGSLTQRISQNNSLKNLNIKTLNTDRDLDDNYITKGTSSKQLRSNHSVQLKQPTQKMRKKYIYNTPQVSKNNENILDFSLNNSLKNYNITMHDIYPVQSNHKGQDLSNHYGRQLQINSIMMKSKQILQKNIKQPINEQSQNLQHSQYNPQKQPQIANVPKYHPNQYRNTKQFRHYNHSNHSKSIDMHAMNKDSLQSSKQRKSQLRSDRFTPNYNYTNQYHNQSMIITQDFRQKCNNHKEKQIQYKLQKENINRMHSQIEALLKVVNKTKNTVEKSCVLSEYSDRMIEPLTLTLPVSMQKKQSSSQLSATKNKQNPSKTQRIQKVYQYSNMNLQQNLTARQNYEQECDKQILLDISNKMGKKSWQADKRQYVHLPHQTQLNKYFLPTKRNAENIQSSKKSLYNRKNITVDTPQNTTLKYRCRIQQSKIVPMKSPTFTPFQTPNAQSHLRIQPVVSQQLSNFPSHINQNRSRLNNAQSQINKKYPYKYQNQQNWQQYEEQSSEYVGLIDQQILRIRQRIQNSQRATRQMQSKYLNSNNNILNNTNINNNNNNNNNNNKYCNKTNVVSKYTDKNVSVGKRGVSPTIDNSKYNANKIDYSNNSNNVNISSFNPQINSTQPNKIFKNPHHKLSNKNVKAVNNSNYDSKKNKKNQFVKKLAYIMDKQIAKDIQLRELREQLMSFVNNEGNMKKKMDQYDDKWRVLSTKLERKGFYYDQKQLKQLLQISSDQTNPFNSVSSQGSIHSTFDKLCQNICEQLVLCQKFWTDHIVSCLDINEAEQSNFGAHTIDLNKKGYLSIEDIVCFVNLYTGKFYKNRDVMLVFKRFCRRGALDARKNKINFEIFNDIVFGRNEY